LHLKRNSLAEKWGLLHAHTPRQRICHLSFGPLLAGLTEKAMTSSSRRANPPDDPDLARRRFLEQLGATDRVMQADTPDTVIYRGSGHIMGTTLMGSDSKASVVDKDCRTHDHPNLFILGSSVFPTGATANPTSTVAALALRAAETIKQQLKS
jgi:choline dehydrogenase-like flavoprotein